MQPKRLFIIDAMAMAFRSFYAFGMRPLTTANGQPVSAVFGTAMLMNKLVNEQRPDYLIVTSDSREKTFRHDLYSAYKANRSEMPEDLAVQLPHFFRLLAAYGCPVLRRPGLEADDLIGSLARRFASDALHVYIVSGDKDFCQLINDQIFMYTPKKGDEAVLVDRAGVVAKFGVAPEQVIDCLAITGDASDNVPGVHGIGEKGAAKLVSEFGSLDGIYANLDRVANKKQRTALEEHKERAYLSRQLVTIVTDATLGIELADAACDPELAVANAAMLTLMRELEFRTMTARIEAAMLARGENLAAVGAAPAAIDLAVGAAGALARSDEPDGPPDRPHLTAAPSPQKAAATVASYQRVDTPPALAALVRELKDARAFAFDTETTGLDVAADHPIGISIAVHSGAAWYVPLVDKHLTGITPAEVLAALRPVFAAADAIKVGHNLKFDLAMLNNVGLTVRGPFVDTMICDWLLDATARTHGLDACCLKHLRYEKIKTASLIGAKGEIPMLDCDVDELVRYACEDADLTMRLYHKLMPEIDKAGLGAVLRDIDMPLVPVLARMEQTGVFVDLTALKGLSARLGEAAARLEAEIHLAAGEEFNVNSPKQLSEILFGKLKVHEQLGIKKLRKTKTGYSTDESVLQKLEAHPLPKALLEYRAVAKLKGTYVDALPTMVSRQSGRIHTSFHQTGTATGRLSSSEPNLQNIPIRTGLGQEIRKAFRAGEPGWVILSADYSQIELRLLAHLAGEEALTRAFAAGEDIHRLTASRIFGVPPAEVDATMRSRAKAINFGIIYGMGPRRLAAETGVTLAEAASFIERYFASYPGISRFIEQSVQDARESGETRTVTGRRRPLDGLDDGNRGTQVSAEHIAVNTPIQGSAADLIKLAMIEIDRRLMEKGLKARMVLQVHDELVFECPQDEAKEAQSLIRHAMQNAMRLDVPLEVAVGVGANWLEAH